MPGEKDIFTPKQGIFKRLSNFLKDKFKSFTTSLAMFSERILGGKALYAALAKERNYFVDSPTTEVARIPGEEVAVKINEQSFMQGKVIENYTKTENDKTAAYVSVKLADGTVQDFNADRVANLANFKKVNRQLDKDEKFVLITPSDIKTYNERLKKEQSEKEINIEPLQESKKETTKTEPEINETVDYLTGKKIIEQNKEPEIDPASLKFDKSKIEAIEIGVTDPEQNFTDNLTENFTEKEVKTEIKPEIKTEAKIESDEIKIDESEFDVAENATEGEFNTGIPVIDFDEMDKVNSEAEMTESENPVEAKQQKALVNISQNRQSINQGDVILMSTGRRNYIEVQVLKTFPDNSYKVQPVNGGKSSIANSMILYGKDEIAANKKIDIKKLNVSEEFKTAMGSAKEKEEIKNETSLESFGFDNYSGEIVESPVTKIQSLDEIIAELDQEEIDSDSTVTDRIPDLNDPEL